MWPVLAPVLYAVFVWWFSTGVIIFLDRLPRRTYVWSMLAATVVSGLALACAVTSATDPTASGAYQAFTAALVFWGWQEISFYTGYVTGPRTTACRAGCSGPKHFWHAVETTLWHEITIIVAAAVLYGLTRGTANMFGLWTFLALWWMHESAKLNVYFGVPNLAEEFLPDHMQFLKGFITRKPMNLLFPVSVTVSTIITWQLGVSAWTAPAGSFAATGYWLLTTLMGLAVLEHWFLVVPLPSEKLWRWSLPGTTQDPTPAPAECTAIVKPRGAEGL